MKTPEDGPQDKYEDRWSGIFYNTAADSADVQARLKSGELYDSDASHWTYLRRHRRDLANLVSELNREARRFERERAKRQNAS